MAHSSEDEQSRYKIPLPKGNDSGCGSSFVALIILGVAALGFVLWLVGNDIYEYFTFSPTQKTQKNLKEHVWVFDSIYTENEKHVDVYQEPKTEWEFTDTTITSSHSWFYNDAVNNYELHDTNKLYYWAQNNLKNLNQYFVIKQLDDTSLIAVENNSSYGHRTYYFHAKTFF